MTYFMLLFLCQVFKSGVYFTLTAHPNSDKPHFKCSMTTRDYCNRHRQSVQPQILPFWRFQVLRQEDLWRVRKLESEICFAMKQAYTSGQATSSFSPEGVSFVLRDTWSTRSLQAQAFSGLQALYRQIYKEKSRVETVRVFRDRRNEKTLFNGHRVSVWDDDKL